MTPYTNRQGCSLLAEEGLRGVLGTAGERPETACRDCDPTSTSLRRKRID